MLGAPACLDFLVDRSRHHVARGELFLFRVVLEHEPLALGILQIAALAADRLGDQDAAHPGWPDHAGRMELHHFRVEHLGPGVEAYGDAVAGAFPGVRGDLEDAAPAAGRQDDSLRAEGHEAPVDPVVADGAHHPLAILQQAGERHLHVYLDAELDHAILQAADHLQAGAIAHVAETPVRMRAKSALQDAAVRRPVEDRAVSLQLVHPVRRLLGVQLRHPPVVDQLAASHGVLEVDLPVVVGVDVPQCRGDAALGHDGVRLTEQRLADDGDPRPGRGGLDRSPQPGAAGADHEDVGRPRLVSLGHAIHLGSWMMPAISSRT